VKKQGRKFEAELDWYYISKQSVGKALVVFSVIALALVIGISVYVRKNEATERRAKNEIEKAEDLIKEARTLPEARQLAHDIDAASQKAADARTVLEAGNVPQAITEAIEAQSIARRLLAGDQARGEASIIETGGKVEVQRASRSNWESAKIGMKLYEGDFVKTGNNGVAEVMAADGTLYKISNGVLMEVHRTISASPVPGGPKPISEMKLIVGTVGTRTGEDGRSKIMTEGANLEIQQRSEARVDVDESKKTKFEVIKGGGTATTPGGQKVTVNEREGTSIGRDGVVGPRVRLPDAPSPMFPDDNVVYDIARKDPVALRWTLVREATKYRLQIAGSRIFIPDSIIIDVSDRVKPEAVFKVKEEGQYFWRIASVGKSPTLVSEWSQVRKFRILSQVSHTGQLPDTIPPDLVVSRPKPSGNIVIVEGKTEPGATVTVDDEPADLDPSGAFKKILSINKEGLHTITIKAVDTAGNPTVRRENVLIQY
jgi:hypothetical protein